MYVVILNILKFDILQDTATVEPIRKSRTQRTSEAIDVSFVESKDWFDRNIRQKVAGTTPKMIYTRTKIHSY